MVKLIATDMDGTFLNDQNQFPEDFYSVFDQLKQRGIIFGAASGRQYYNLAERFHDVQDDMLFIAENGSYVVYKGEEIYSNTLNKEDVIELIQTARKIDGIHIVLCGKKSAYFEPLEDKAMTEIVKYYAKRQVVNDLLQVDDEILKISILDFNGAESNSFTYFNEYKEKLQVTIGGYVWLDIMNAGSNKGIAMQKVQEFFNIQAQETMVFGDYLNDLEMMEQAYFSYAMANAHDRIKKVARFQAKTNNESGVTEVIKELLTQSR